MVALTSLWLPIVLSAVLVFIVSAIFHTAPLWHRRDYPAVPNQEALRAALGPMNIPPGEYMVPRTFSSAEMKTPEFQEKMKAGPVMIMTVMPPGPWRMGRTLSLWFVYIVIVSYFSAYIASRALGPGIDYLEVFRFAGATAFIGYSVALWQLWIWYGRSLSMTIKDTFDGLIYALLTAGVFGWLWPR